jgi:hypothetical protein
MLPREVAMKKNATEILANLEEIPQDYREVKQVHAKSNRDVLRRLLGDITMQRELCHAFTVRKQGYPINSSYPDWAYDLGHLLIDPKKVYSEEIKELVFDYCVKLVGEFGGNEEYYLDYFREHQVPLLSEIAWDLTVKMDHIIH